MRVLLRLAGACALLSVAKTASAARSRPLFEPTDLELEEPGMMELDLQLGVVRSDVPWRLVVPDVELDLGLTPDIELGIDAAYAIEGPDDGRLVLDHPAPDNIWLSSKLGLLDF